MGVRVCCPHPNCGKRYKVGEELLGRKTVCKECGREFTVAAAGHETLRRGEQDDTEESHPPRPVPSRQPTCPRSSAASRSARGWGPAGSGPSIGPTTRCWSARWL